MEYENVDEVAKRQACERVKQIVKAIKNMKIKYYLDFSKISEKDKETYQKLEEALERVSSAHNLEGLKVALMSEVSARYDRGSSDGNGQGSLPNPDDILQACYGVIDAHKEALSRGKLTQAKKCQEILGKYKEQINSQELLDEIRNYQIKKFGELAQLREQSEQGQTRQEIEEKREENNNINMKKLMTIF